VRAQFGWIDERLSARDFILGATPGLPDALAYYLVWFLRDRMAEGESFLSQFKNLVAWEQRVKAIGHGAQEGMSDLDALEIARQATPQSPQQSDPGDPMGLTVGAEVAVSPSTGGPAVAGILHGSSANHVTLMRNDDQVGQICVNFPRLGYRVNVRD
jgi:glutathione S-transferase